MSPPPPRDPPPPHPRATRGATSGERTVMFKAPVFERPPKPWKPFRFQNLEKVSRLQAQLARRLEWMLPGIKATGEVSESVRGRLKELLEEDVSLSVDYVHVVQPRTLRKYVGDPTFLAVVAPQPNKTRGFIEVDLGLAHTAIDMLLGGTGEAMALRPLTDIEEGVMTYVVIETLKSFAPSLDPSLPRLRLEGVAHGFEEMVQLLGDEQHLAVAQLKAVFGTHTGYVRLFLPATVLSMANPPSDAAVRRARRAQEAQAHLSRLKAVKTWLRAEIGQVEITAGDLSQLRERDVVLVDQLSARPDKGEGGAAKLKVGLGRVGHFDAEITLQGGRFRATLKGVQLGEGPPPGGGSEEAAAAEAEAAAAGEEGADGAEGEGGPDTVPPELGEGPDESTNPGQPNSQGAKVDETMKSQEGADLLNDIPLQIAVELARVPITAEDVVGLKVGQVIDLNRVPGEPIDLSVNGRVVARGEIVEIEGNLGVRVLSLNGSQRPAALPAVPRGCPMKRWSAVAAAVLGVLVLGASSCGPALLGSCTAPAGAAGTPTLCIEYESHPSGASGLQQVCQAQTGSTWSTAACSATNRVGRCKILSTSGGVSSTSVEHYYAPLTQDQARTACQGRNGTDRTATFLD